MSEGDRRLVAPEHIRVVRVGHGANCSSIGSVVDTLFVGSLAVGAIFAAVAAALAREPIREEGPERGSSQEPPPGPRPKGEDTP